MQPRPQPPLIMTDSSQNIINTATGVEVTPQFMNSIADECNELKKAYDDCFNAWFSEKFLRGDRNLSRCDVLLQLYTGCVKNAMKAKSIDVNEVDKEHLGTPNEKPRPPSPS